MTAVDLRHQIERLQAERMEALRSGIDTTCVVDLENDIAEHRQAYIGLAVTEIATLRAELGGRNVG